MKLTKILYILFSIIFLAYLSLPNSEFPAPPPDALQSDEPGDTETPLRRAYFTNYTREEVMEHYKNEFKRSYRLNYPPEEAQTLVHDQTRSTFLEEIVHPFRDSFFVNGFEPKEAEAAIFIEGKIWRQKITVRYNPSNTPLRLILGIMTLTAMAIIFKEYLQTFGKIRI